MKHQQEVAEPTTLSAQMDGLVQNAWEETI